MLYPDGSRYSLSAPDFMSVRQDTRAFEQIEAVDDIVGTLIEGEPREVRIARVSDGLFRQLGIDAVEGRTFLADEHAPGRGAVVVLGHAFWMQAFGGDRGVLGRVLTFGDGRFEVVGVLKPGARLIEAADVYRPLTYGPTFDATTVERAAFGVPDRDRPRATGCRRPRRQRRPAGSRRTAAAGVSRHERGHDD